MGQETEATIKTLKSLENLYPNFLADLDVIFGKVANAAFVRGCADGAVDMDDAITGHKP